MPNAPLLKVTHYLRRQDQGISSEAMDIDNRGWHVKNLGFLDVLVVILYFAAVAAIAIWSIRRKKEKTSDFFLAGRDLGWIAVGSSIFLSNVGSEHLVGLTGTGASSGLAVGQFEWLACLILLLLGWVFAPFYLQSAVYTMPEFLERRYNSACRWFFSLLSILAYILTKISVSLYAGGVIISQLTGLNIMLSAGIVVIVTGLYTVLGGLRAVAYTDIMQTVVLVLGSSLLVYFGLEEVGGWSELKRQTPEHFFSVWRPIDDPNFPWTGILFGAPILGVWYWCTDQNIVQRVLSAKNLAHARSGTILAGYLKILPMFLFVLPGVIAAVLFKTWGTDISDQALPLLIQRLLGPGLKGLFIAALLAALMSSLAAVFNSCSTLITWDIYKKLRPHASDPHLVRIGQIASTIMVLLGLGWIPLMKYISSHLYIYLQSVQGYLAPPISACFLLGLFFTRLNGKGAISALLIGFFIGALRMILEIIQSVQQPFQSGFWHWFVEMNFLHFALLLFVFSCVVLVVVSLLTEIPDAKRIAGLTWKTRMKQAEQGTAWHKRINESSSWLLIVIILILWMIF